MLNKRAVSKYFTMAIFVSIIVLMQVSVSSSFAEEGKISSVKSSLDMTLKEASRIYSMSPRSLASELGLKEPVSKRTPMAKLGVTYDDLSMLEKNISLDDLSGYLFVVYFAAAFIGALYLLFIVKSKLENRGLNLNRRLVYIFTLTAVIVVAFVFGKSPNAMQSVSKMLKALSGVYPDIFVKIAVFGFFIVLSVIVNKIICGWACPAGAIQELIFSVPILRKIKKKKVPFFISNGIRIALFVATLIFLFGNYFLQEGRTLYHYVNVFNLFDFRFNEPLAVLTMVLAFVTSIFVYRPFCSFICPFGLISWFFERVSLYKIKIDRTRCSGCNRCESACPTHAIKDYLNDKKLPADCFSCSRCMDACPENAIEFKRGR